MSLLLWWKVQPLGRALSRSRSNGRTSVLRLLGLQSCSSYSDFNRRHKTLIKNDRRRQPTKRPKNGHFSKSFSTQNAATGLQKKRNKVQNSVI
jgi:hypothetical protein